MINTANTDEADNLSKVDVADKPENKTVKICENSKNRDW